MPPPWPPSASKKRPRATAAHSFLKEKKGGHGGLRGRAHLVKPSHRAQQIQELALVKSTEIRATAIRAQMITGVSTVSAGRTFATSCTTGRRGDGFVGTDGIGLRGARTEGHGLYLIRVLERLGSWPHG